MRSIIQQICNGDLHLNERTTACVSEFRAVRDIAVQVHANRLSETVQESYINRPSIARRACHTHDGANGRQ